MGPVSKLLFCFLFVMPNIKAFTVDIVNITTCKNSDDELGTLDTDIESEEAPDQLFNADFNLPMDLDKDTMVEYESNAWSKGKWKFLFKGKRSLCNSIMTTTAYARFANQVKPKFPKKCSIPEGDYKITRFPISGQYVVLSDIKKAPALVKHKVTLWVDDTIILCRIVYTNSNN